jgi:hypothetical protein
MEKIVVELDVDAKHNMSLCRYDGHWVAPGQTQEAARNPALYESSRQRRHIKTLIVKPIRHVYPIQVSEPLCYPALQKRGCLHFNVQQTTP